MALTQDEQFMQQALAVARKGIGTASLNPMVGAVLVKGGQVIATGYHKAPGTPHAEAIALKKAGNKAKGATLYCTLEPCNHWGRTGPCTEAIIEAGVKQVVFAIADPNRQVKGNGARRLKAAGIKVTSGVLHNEASLLNEAFIHRHKTGLPLVILKMAQTLDGKIATARGESNWITGPEARRIVHQLRSEVDAVVVGGETVRKDNPRLTVRSVKGRNPYRIIISESGKIPADVALFRENRDLKTIITTSEAGAKRLKAAAKKHCLILWQLRKTRGGLDLHDFLKQAAAFGFLSLLVEGGSQLATSFWQAGLVDKYIAMIAPSVLGDGIPTIGDFGAKKLDRKTPLTRTTMHKVGDDYMLVAYPKWGKR